MTKQSLPFGLIEGGRDTNTAPDTALGPVESLAPVRAFPATPIRRTVNLAAPPITKSGIRALECPVYYTGEYLQPVMESTHPLLITGQQFHEWRLKYLLHLMETGQHSDPAFREAYLTSTPLSRDVRKLIEYDEFAIDPDTIWGPEVFLSVDDQWEPKERLRGGKHEVYTDDYAHGTLDLILISRDGKEATVLDYKSGFSTTGIHDAEPKLYAALVFAHFKTVERVNWTWEFPRLGLGKHTTYTRGDLKWIHPEIDRYVAKGMLAVAEYNADRDLLPNPLSGLCPYCNLACPLRPRWEAGDLAIGPIQTRQDAERVARLNLISKAVLQRSTQLLKSWMDQDPVLELGAGWRAEVQNQESITYPVVHALHQLGLGVIDITDKQIANTVLPLEPAATPLFDIPLKSLKLSGTSSFTKSKKSRAGVSREGLKERLRTEGSFRHVVTKVKISKSDSVDVIDVLSEGDEEDDD